MSTYEAAYKSLLQGVSQQLPEERLPGQLTAQVNMVSDPVTNIRRRPGVLFKKAWAWADAEDSGILGWFTDIAGARVHILLNTATGNIRVLDEDFNEEASLDAGSYLVSADPSRIRTTSVGNEFFLVNIDKLPTLEYDAVDPDPANSGFFYVVSGAFSKVYNITVVHSGGTISATYTTPSGTGTGDAALATPEYIAEQLYDALALDVSLTVTRDGPYVFVHRAASSTISVNTGVGSGFLIASKGGVVTEAGALPARLPAVADGFICRVGTGKSPQYYRYTHAITEWSEVGVWGSPTSVSNTPISVYWNGSAWALDASDFEGRTSGDDTSNEVHEWMENGITGISTYQGRLVLMSGPLVSLSASNVPRRFFRRTVSSLLSNDPIEVGSSLNSAAAYQWAVPFQKDLVLFSRAYQAVIPSGNQAITPATATVVPTSAHETDTTCSPVVLGRTLMYCSPRSADFFGTMEMIPSTYTDSQYVSQDSTPHLPKYMGGRCRFAVSSSVASLALFAPSGDTNSLVVHEYHWDGEDKVQQAWHMWTFAYPVAAAYFASDVIVLAFVKNNQIVLGTVDPRAGSLNAAAERRPFLDMYTAGTITANNVPIPSWMLAFDPDVADELRLVLLAGGLAGEPVGASVAESGTDLTTVLSHPSGTVGIGIPYYSGVVPTAPVVRDYNSEVIHTGKATLLRYLVGTKNSSEFTVRVSDAFAAEDASVLETLSWSSPELETGRGLFANTGISLVPCRTDLRSTSMELSTTGTGELNITSLEYVAKYNPKVKRR